MEITLTTTTPENTDAEAKRKAKGSTKANIRAIVTISILTGTPLKARSMNLQSDQDIPTLTCQRSTRCHTGLLVAQHTMTSLHLLPMAITRVPPGRTIAGDIIHPPHRSHASHTLESAHHLFTIAAPHQSHGNRLENLLDHQEDLSGMIPSLPLVPNDTEHDHALQLEILEGEGIHLPGMLREESRPLVTQEEEARQAQEGNPPVAGNELCTIEASTLPREVEL